MQLDDYLKAIEDIWPDRFSHSEWVNNDVNYDSIRTLLEGALEAYPDSSSLWCIKGDFILLTTRAWDNDFDVDARIRCYEKAVDLDQTNYYSYEGLGYVMDVYRDDYVAAEQYFRKSILLGGGLPSFLGLARVLAETERRVSALNLIAEATSRFGKHPDIIELTAEIASGIWDRE